MRRIVNSNIWSFAAAVFLLCLALQAGGQVIPQSRSTDWTIAGLRDTSTAGFAMIDMQLHGITGDGLTPNDSVLAAVISGLSGSGAILLFPAGDFLFQQTIHLPSGIVIRGQGPASTRFISDLGGSGHSIQIQGASASSPADTLVHDALKDNNYIIIDNPAVFTSGGWIRIHMQDSALLTSGWAWGTVGQIARISGISGDTLFLESPLRRDFQISQQARVTKLSPVTNTGIECLALQRIDNTAPEQSSVIQFRYAVNSWVRGVESVNTTFAHIEAEWSSNLSVSGSYLHHAFDYGENGRAYGIMLHFSSGECRVEDNILEHLRHSMIVQAGANGNVFAFNYSLDPWWSSLPSNSAGDMVLHGNYVFLNLFEQNICRNIVIDDSHGPNGPYNTFFRNRAEGYGIFFSAANSPEQNLVGNDISNTSFPYSLVNYTILGSGHLKYGNNNKGTIDPVGTQNLADVSYAYLQPPPFVPLLQWAAIGTPNVMGSASNPARDRYLSGNLFNGVCGPLVVDVGNEILSPGTFSVFPNPFRGELNIECEEEIARIIIADPSGKVMLMTAYNGRKVTMNTRHWAGGWYVVNVVSQTERLFRETVFCLN